MKITHEMINEISETAKNLFNAYVHDTNKDDAFELTKRLCIMCECCKYAGFGFCCHNVIRNDNGKVIEINVFCDGELIAEFR